MALKNLAILAVAAIVVAVALKNHQGSTLMRVVAVGSTEIQVEIADSSAKRVLGLSGREGLAPNSGMLFIFDSDQKWGMWMKDMRFPLDIIWADAVGNIVTIARGISPESYPKVFEPSAPARYALEVPAGWSAAHGVVEGDKVVVK